MSIEELAEYIKPPLKVLYNDGKIIHNDHIIAAICEEKHIHKYYLSKIVERAPVCITCTNGTKFSHFARRAVESLLNTAFVYRSTTSTFIEYYNPIYKLVIRCARKNFKFDEDSADNVICFNETTSVDKLYMRLKECVSLELIDIHDAIDAHFKMDPPTVKKYYKRDKLPFVVDPMTETTTVDNYLAIDS